MAAPVTGTPLGTAICSLIRVLLLVCGVAGPVGNFAAGAVVGRAPRGGVTGSSGLPAVVMAVIRTGSGASTPLAVPLPASRGVPHAPCRSPSGPGDSLLTAPR